MIQLTDRLAVTADNECYIVGRVYKRNGSPAESGEKAVELRDPRYYTTLAQAVRAAASRTLRAGIADGSITTLQEFIREAERITAEFTEKLKPLEA